MKYSFNDAKYGTHYLLAEEVGSGGSVLDIGCNKGYLKKLAIQNDFFGIDFDEADLKQAKNEGYMEVYKLDLNKYKDFVCNRKFDTIIFGDVLEHLINPREVVRFFSDKYLKERGKILISLPNVANFAIRFNLFFGNFDYTDNGILDKTHLHLYTKKTSALLIEECGLNIDKKKYSLNNFGWIIKKCPFLGGLLGFNLIFICRKKY